MIIQYDRSGMGVERTWNNPLSLLFIVIFTVDCNEKEYELDQHIGCLNGLRHLCSRKSHCPLSLLTYIFTFLKCIYMDAMNSEYTTSLLVNSGMKMFIRTE